MQGIEIVAELMNISAITAPKSKGQNFVRTKILKDDIIKKLADEMFKFGQQTGKANFDRDAKNVEASECIMLIGLKDASVLGLDCGVCGFTDCKTMTEHSRKQSDSDFQGPICAFRLLDLGIAMGSAVKTASMLNVDNRIMYRIGIVARHCGIVDWDYVMGIPLSVTGKNIYFDR